MEEQGVGSHAWVRYKLRAAWWYIETLDAVGLEVGEWDRYVGIEMALDGALSALCGAFDAAVGEVRQVAEVTLGEGPVTGHLSNWRACRDRLSRLRAGEDVVEELDVALDRTPTGPLAVFGWLAQVQEFRNRAVHENTIRRAFSVGTGPPARPTLESCRISIDGAGAPVDPLTFLRERHGQLAALCERLLDLADLIRGSSHARALD